jgi:hypothetical protein
MSFTVRRSNIPGNDKLDARNPFFALKPERRLDQYGGVIGGPIIKDKLFFFFSYEGTRKRVGIVNVQVSVPQRR